MTPLPEHDPVLRDKVRRLMGVFRQLAVAKTRPIRNIAAYQQMLLLADATDHLPVSGAMEPGEEILRAERVQRNPEPPCPASVGPWLDHTPGSLTEPVLWKTRAVSTDRTITLDDHPDVVAAFQGWVREWRAWAAEERLRRPRAALFRKLFDLHRIAQERPESVELVIASGLLHVPDGYGEAGVRVHLVTQPVTVEQDPVSGAMVCALMPDSAIRLESEEVLSGLPLFDQSGSAVLRDRLLESVSSPLDPAILPYLKEWADRALLVSHKVSDQWTLPAGQVPELGFAPALVARRRGAFALREYYDAITTSQSDENSPVPLGLAQLVEGITPVTLTDAPDNPSAIALRHETRQASLPRVCPRRRVAGRLGVLLDQPGR